MAAYLMDRFLDRHWKFKIVDKLPVRGGQNLVGHCSWDWRIIRVSREYIFDYPLEGITWILTHEVAHALTPEDWTHGEVFQARWKKIRQELTSVT